MAANSPKRNLDGSLDQMKEELRDAYMNFMELHDKCVIDITTIKKDNSQVYYFRPDTFLLDEPQKQTQYREALLRKISCMPKPEPITYMGDDLHRAFSAIIADQSRPTVAKKNLALFFKRRQYMLQHLKYKMLCRWAHLCIDSKGQETTGRDAVFLYGKLEYSLEQAMQRNERLEQEDMFDMADPTCTSFRFRPNTKAEHGTGSLYVEKVDLEPQSLIREDDVEIWLRSVTYRNKVSKVVNKFMSRLKWLPMQSQYKIYEEAMKRNKEIKDSNIERQLKLINEVETRAKELQLNHVKSPEMRAELDDIIKNYFASKYKSMYASETEKSANAWRADHEIVPELVNNIHELKILILRSAALYDLKGPIELDHGYSFSYQITVKFPPYFQR